MAQQNDTDLRLASENERSIIERMMDPYLSDLGGMGPYPHLESYWSDPPRRPYLILQEQQPVGFALVEKLPGEFMELVEFYVQRSSRGRGVGRRAAVDLFRAHEGIWRVGVRMDNVSGQRFWRALLGVMPSVRVTEHPSPPAVIYEFMSPFSEA